MRAQTQRGHEGAGETHQNLSSGLALGALNPSGTQITKPAAARLVVLSSLSEIPQGQVNVKLHGLPAVASRFFAFGETQARCSGIRQSMKSFDPAQDTRRFRIHPRASARGFLRRRVKN